MKLRVCQLMNAAAFRDEEKSCPMFQTAGKMKEVNPEGPGTTLPSFKSSVCGGNTKQIQGLGTRR